MHEAYALALEDLTVEQIQFATKRALQTCKFMPSAAELLELSGYLSPADRAELAWAVVGDAMRQHGFYKSVDFDDATINATIRALGGWAVFCEQADGADFQQFTKARFAKTYAAYCRAGVSAEAGAPLLGNFATENRRLGHAAPEPIKIQTGLATQINPTRLESPRATMKGIR